MREIDVLELKAWREQGKEHQLVDVREPHEYEAGNLGGIHIPMGDILLRQGELKTDIPVVMQCRSGGRSAAVVTALQETKLRKPSRGNCWSSNRQALRMHLEK